MSLDTESWTDRRAYDRIPARFPVTWADHYYEWKGECLNFGAGGCYVLAEKPLKPGKKLTVKLMPPREAELELPGKVAFATSDGMGLSLDVRAPEAFERAIDLFERMIARDTSLAVRLKTKPRLIEPSTVLYATPAALAAGAVVNAEEKRILSQFNDAKRVDELKKACGDAWLSHVHAVFALVERGILTTNRALAARPEDLASGRPRAPAPVEAGAAPSGPRPPQAEKYYQKGKDDLAAGNKLSALTNFKLALMLAPGDPVILKIVDELDVKKK